MRPVSSVARTRVRNWRTKTNLAVVFASVTLVIVLSALIEAIAGALPILAWVGFGIVSVIVRPGRHGDARGPAHARQRTGTRNALDKTRGCW